MQTFSHLKHPLLDDHTGVPGHAEQVAVKGVKVVHGRGEVGQLGSGERVEGGGKDDEGVVMSTLGLARPTLPHGSRVRSSQLEGLT